MADKPQEEKKSAESLADLIKNAAGRDVQLMALAAVTAGMQQVLKDYDKLGAIISILAAQIMALIVVLHLKQVGIIDWNYFWLTCPIWGVFAFGLVTGFVRDFTAAFKKSYDEAKKK